MFYVYLLQSEKFDQIYVGSTVDLRKRLLQHNNGESQSTNRYKPWKLVYYEAYEQESLARTREHNLKHYGNSLKELKRRAGIIKIETQ